MARKRSFEFSDDDDFAETTHSTHINDAELSESGSAGLHGMGDDMLDETASGQRSGKAATSRAAQQAQTATQTRSSAAQQADSPTSMNDKRGNQPR